MKDNDFFVEQNYWRIPTKLNGINKILFTIQYSNASYEIVDIGGKQLANELQSLEGKGIYSTFLLRLYEQSIDFILNCTDKTKLKTAYFYPLESAKNYCKNKQQNESAEYYSLQEILAILKN